MGRVCVFSVADGSGLHVLSIAGGSPERTLNFPKASHFRQIPKSNDSVGLKSRQRLL
jgi:hypothetical protein